MAVWIKNRLQAIKEVFEFDFWEWLFLTRNGRATAMMLVTGLATFFGTYIGPMLRNGLIGAFIASAIILIPSMLTKKRNHTESLRETPSAVSAPKPEPLVKPLDDERLTLEEIKFYVAQIEAIKRDLNDYYNRPIITSPHKDRLEYVRKLQEMITTGRRPR